MSTSKPLNKTCLMFATRFSVEYHKSQSINYCYRLFNMVAADNPVIKIFYTIHSATNMLAKARVCLSWVKQRHPYIFKWVKNVSKI